MSPEPSFREICFLTATELARRIRDRRLSAREVMQAHLDQIAQLNPAVNALVTLLPDRAMAEAVAADEAQARGVTIGTLHGLPIAHKDLLPTRGIRTTFGSPVFVDYLPAVDALIVERLRAAGAICVGKTNTPELGAGSQTYNELFGATRNPYDLTRTCGGSSGGTAVALACGMQPIGDGTDFGGSLRNPASFCNVVGFRPSPGRIPIWPADLAWFTMDVHGPMARTVEDVALIMSAIAGADSRSPVAIDESGSIFKQPLSRSFAGTRVAWSRDLGGLPVDRQVRAALEAQRPALESLGCVVEEAEPDFKGAVEAFTVWRSWRTYAVCTALSIPPDSLKPTLAAECAVGATMTGPQLARAELGRTALYHRVREFLQRYEFLVLPVSQVPPFDVEQPYVTAIEDVSMDSYIDWMRSCYYISTVELPAISVPAGFTVEGLPIGMQIVGRHHDDLGVLQLAHAFEQATGFWKRRPPIVSGR